MNKAMTLVINAPYWKGKPKAQNTWEWYFQTGVGKTYAIPKKDVDRLMSLSQNSIRYGRIRQIN